MDNPLIAKNVVCRPALPMDTEQVFELCSHIWEGEDYIPQVWDEWLADPEGLLGVAELGSRVAGIFKLTKFQDTEWYLEGLRVHPDFRGRGVAAHIHAYVLDTWRKIGKGIIRLLTASDNVKVHHMCEQSGFKRIAEFIPYRAPVLNTGSNTFSALQEEEAQEAFDFVMKSPTHALSAGLVNLGWVFADLQIRHINELISDQHAWWWRNKAGFLSIWEDSEDEERTPGIQLIACSLADLPELLVDYRKLMADRGYKSTRWVAPSDPEVIHSLDMAGFKRAWNFSLYVFELRSEAR